MSMSESLAPPAQHMDEAQGAAAGRPRLVVFGDDWGRHPSSIQHLVHRLLPSYRVDWVNTVGMRRPRLDLTTVRRGTETLLGWAGRGGAAKTRPEEATRPAADAPRVHAPVYWPSFHGRFERALNARLLRRALRPLLTQWPPPVAVVTTVPIVSGVAEAFPDLNWIYYCVDDFGAWPGLDGAAIRHMERELLPLMRHVISASEVLRQRLRAMGADSEVLTHGVDLSQWHEVRRRPPRAAGARPAALYWGCADGRLDPEICLAVAGVAELHVVGPRREVDRRLLDHPAIHWHKPVPYEKLPDMAETADVLVMPYGDQEVTRAMQPLKLKEYLATPLPVVATPLPACRAWADAMDVTASPAEFARFVAAQAQAPTPPGHLAARARLREESWDRKAAAFRLMLTRDAV